MRSRLRAFGVMTTFAFRVDRRRALGCLVLTLVSQLSAVGVAASLGLLTEAVIRHSDGQLGAGAALLGISILGTSAGSWTTFLVWSRLRELTLLAVDRELASLSGTAVGIEHLERGEYLDHIDHLRQYRNNLVSFPTRAASAAGVVVRLVLTLALLAAIDPELALLPLFGVPAMAATYQRNKMLSRAFDEHVTRLNRLQGATRRLAGSERGGREIRIFGLRDEIRRRYQEILGEHDRVYGNVGLRASFAVAGGWAIFGVAFALALLLLAHRTVRGDISAGALVTAITLAAQINSHLGNFAGTINQVGGSLNTAQRLVSIRDYVASGTKPRDTAAPLPRRLRDGVQLESVTFTYPDTDTPVLREVDLLLPAGSTVALVGANGAGKSTLVKLLLRMYEPTQGRILVDDHDLRDLDVTEWRHRTSAGFQDFARFELTAQHAVGTGELPHLDDHAAVLAALERAHSTDVLETLPDGLASQLGRQFSTGVELSGGQWQKIALGRTMMRTDPLLLVLDEPTASLDAVTEAALFEHFAGAAHRASRLANGITLIVSHRFSTVRAADLIIVISDGHITERGTHHELIARRGTYAELYELQAKPYR